MQSYHHFTLEEREILWELQKEGTSIRKIAKEINRSPSSVSREIARNKNKDNSYHPWRATTLYIIRRRNSVRTYRIETDIELLENVRDGLNKFWSPEIIVERWKAARPDSKLSHSTIYTALKRGRLPDYKEKTHLRRRGKRRYSHCNSATIKPEHLIREWTDQIKNRTRLGDWEGDTVLGSINKGLMVTCVDRKSRFLVAALAKNKKAEETSKALETALSGHEVKSLSLDNGSEFANFKDLEKQLGTTIYFADPHSPWQRGSNENINGLIRFFFPKGTDFHQVSHEQLELALDLINNRPRKCLGWLSPVEFLAKCCT